MSRLLSALVNFTKTFFFVYKWLPSSVANLKIIPASSQPKVFHKFSPPNPPNKRPPPRPYQITHLLQPTVALHPKFLPANSSSVRADLRPAKFQTRGCAKARDGGASSAPVRAALKGRDFCAGESAEGQAASLELPARASARGDKCKGALCFITGAIGGREAPLETRERLFLRAAPPREEFRRRTRGERVSWCRV